ncbi:hypothetical protein Tco_0302098, partial [Tanacetum coccineum]
TQRRIQFGVAKKIKNGACKIVLEKAEEARDAAFSAFKALGSYNEESETVHSAINPAAEMGEKGQVFILFRPM